MSGEKSTLANKLSEVMASVTHIPKNGRNAFHKYDYATEADIVAAIRIELSRRNVAIITNVQNCSIVDGKNDKGKSERHCHLTMTVTFIDGETGESLMASSIGEGVDSSDKAAYKAQTGAIKYALLKTFLLPTGDDPEQDAHQNGAQGAHSAPPQQNAAQTQPTVHLTLAKLITERISEDGDRQALLYSLTQAGTIADLRGDENVSRCEYAIDQLKAMSDDDVAMATNAAREYINKKQSEKEQ